jgi:hypothetical protein
LILYVLWSLLIAPKSIPSQNGSDWARAKQFAQR